MELTMPRVWLVGYVLLWLLTAWLWLATPPVMMDDPELDFSDTGVGCVDDCLDPADE